MTAPTLLPPSAAPGAGTPVRRRKPLGPLWFAWLAGDVVLAIVIILLLVFGGKSTPKAVPVPVIVPKPVVTTPAVIAPSFVPPPAIIRQGPLTGGGGTPAAAGGSGFGTILFASGAASLDADATRVVTAAAADLKAEGAASATVTGYADQIGTTPANAGLSQQRADAVATALRALLPGVTVVSASQGAANPVAPNMNADGSDNPAGRAQNRRVTITAP